MILKKRLFVLCFFVFSLQTKVFVNGKTVFMYKHSALAFDGGSIPVPTCLLWQILLLEVHIALSLLAALPCDKFMRSWRENELCVDSEASFFEFGELECALILQELQ